MYVRPNKAVTFLLLLPQLILHFETVASPLIFNCFNIQGKKKKKVNACFKLHKKVKTIKLNYIKRKRNICVCVQYMVVCWSVKHPLLATLSAIFVHLKKLWVKLASLVQTSKTFLWVFKAPWTILKSIWQFCCRAWGTAYLFILGRRWHVQTSDVFRSSVRCYGSWSDCG